MAENKKQRKGYQSLVVLKTFVTLMMIAKKTDATDVRSRQEITDACLRQR